MRPLFDHERLKVYQEALRFIAWVGPLIDEVHEEEQAPYGHEVGDGEKEKEERERF